MPLVDILRARHAQLWLDGHRCRRGGRVAAREKSDRRDRFDALAQKYATRN